METGVWWVSLRTRALRQRREPPFRRASIVARPFLLDRVTGSCVTGPPELGRPVTGPLVHCVAEAPTDGLPGRRVADHCVGWSSCYLRAREHNYRVRFLCRLPPWVRAMRPCGSTVPRRSEPGPPLPSDRDAACRDAGAAQALAHALPPTSPPPSLPPLRPCPPPPLSSAPRGRDRWLRRSCTTSFPPPQSSVQAGLCSTPAFPVTSHRSRLTMVAQLTSSCALLASYRRL